MPTAFTFSAADASAPAHEAPVVFDYACAYENRSQFRTSRWRLTGVSTRSGGNTDAGWLYLRSTRDQAGLAGVELFRHAACADDDRVAAGSASVGAIPAGGVRCTLEAHNASGLAGEFFFDRYAADPDAPVPVLVSLCVDDDLREEYQNLDDLGPGIAHAATGLARFCAAATRKTLLLVSQQFAPQLGGYGAPEHRAWPLAGRAEPDFRRLANPDQLKETAVHWALMLALGSCHERAGQTMYSQLRDYHDQKRKEAIAAWRLTLTADPDGTGQASQGRSVGARYVTRL